MLKYLLLCVWLCSTCFAQNFVIDDFSGTDGCRWSVCKWGKRKNASFKVNDGVMQLRYATPGEDVDGGFSFYAALKRKCDLQDYKYLSFRARSVGAKESTILVYLSREFPAGKSSSFYSIVRLTQEWKTYCLKLKNSSKSMAGKGLFVLTKAASGASRQLDKGGQLKTLNFYTKQAEAIELDDIKLSDKAVDTNPDSNAIAEAIIKHRKYLPYKFKEIIGEDGPLLVDNGKSRFVICPDREAGATGRFAAAELAKYIEMSTGVELAIVDKYSPDQQVIQLIVANDKVKREGFRSEALDRNRILISGNDTRGLLYGVYDFLEKAVGVRWFAPFDYGEVVPQRKQLHLPLWKDASVPKMVYRRFHYCSAGRDVPEPMKHRYIVADWCVKNRYNVELERLVSKSDKPAVKQERLKKIREFYAERGGYIALPTMWGHNYHYWVPPQEYFANNPEYFCLDSSTGKWRAERAQLCATNPDVVKVIVERAVEYFKQYPEREYFPLFQEDGSRLWCQCSKCLALYKGRDINSYKTEHNINLANHVAEKLAEVVPDKKIVTYAYSVTSQPPANVKPRDDVFVTYCLMDFSNPDKFPWQEFSGQELAAWNKLCGGNVIVYTYNYLDFYYTANTVNSLVRSFRYFDLMGVKCSCQESNENWYGVSAYNYYLSARLAWDPWFEEDAYHKDYYEKLYGSAADFIAEYHKLLEHCLSNRKCWLEYGNRTLPHIPDETLKTMQACLSKAEAAVRNDERAGKAVKAQSRGFVYVKAFSDAVVAGSAFQKNLDDASYKLAIDRLAELDKIIKDLVPDRLVPVLALRQTAGMRRNMRENYQRSSAFKELTKNYKILGEIPRQWSFCTDLHNEGENAGWAALGFDYSAWKKINIGDFWGKQGFSKYVGTAWYKTKLKLPAGTEAPALYFVGVDERAWVYLDGKYIGGHHEGDIKKLWSEPFVVKLPPNLKPGEHELTVKVHSSAGEGGIWKPVFLMAAK